MEITSKQAILGHNKDYCYMTHYDITMDHDVVMNAPL